ncbi:MAG: hypothetical protein R2813_08225 [Flavobacteriales bacterium]
MKRLSLVSLLTLMFNLIGFAQKEKPPFDCSPLNQENSNRVYEHLDSTLVWPDQIEKGEMTYVVHVAVIFTQAGLVKELKVERGINPLFDENAIKACEEFKSWNWSSEIDPNSTYDIYKIRVPVPFKPN